MHSLVVTHHLLKVERILLVYSGGERRVGFLTPFPPRALVVQVARAALLNELKLLSGFRKGLARRDLFRLFKGLACLAVDLAIVWAGTMAGLAAYTDQELVRL